MFLPNVSVPATGDVWITALQQAPDRHTTLDAPALDALLVALDDFVDLKCPFTLGHSRAVARLAADAGVAVGLDADRVALTRRAAHVHDIGRIGVSNQIGSKPAGLTMGEFERMRPRPGVTPPQEVATQPPPTPPIVTFRPAPANPG